MLTALTLAAALTLIAVQPLLLRTWPWLDDYGVPRRPGGRRTLSEVLREAAARLPVPAPAWEPHASLGAEYRTGRWAGIEPASSDTRLRQALACAVADGHTQTEANLRAFDLQRQLGNRQLAYDAAALQVQRDLEQAAYGVSYADAQREYDRLNVRDD